MAFKFTSGYAKRVLESVDAMRENNPEDARGWQDGLTEDFLKYIVETADPHLARTAKAILESANKFPNNHDVPWLSYEEMRFNVSR